MAADKEPAATRGSLSPIESPYVAEALDVLYLHLPTAVEQFLKAVLAAVHPTLVADRNPNHLTGQFEKGVIRAGEGTGFADFSGQPECWPLRVRR